MDILGAKESLRLPPTQSRDPLEVRRLAYEPHPSADHAYTWAELFYDFHVTHDQLEFEGVTLGSYRNVLAFDRRILESSSKGGFVR